MSSPGWVILLPVLLPLAAVIACFLMPRAAPSIGVLASLGNLVVALLLVANVMTHGAMQQNLGNWSPPLGIALRVDGLAAVMVLMTGIVAAVISWYSVTYFGCASRASRGFWPLWLLLLASLQALFLSRDLFNLYVTLELTSLAAVALTALEGGRGALVAAMRYLLASIVGSLFYLLGVVFTFHGTGSVDIAVVAREFGTSHGAREVLALSLMTVGLLLKGALFPLHFWLPAAHGSAAAPVSAALSSLVVKGAFVVLLRLWLEAFADEAPSLYGLLGALGAAAVLWGSIQALMQVRAKLLVAYSTVAQLGYLFLVLPLVGHDAWAWPAIVLLAFAHALAKASMFLAVGNLQTYAGHDRIAELDHVVQRMPVSVAALSLAGVSIMGLPPSGGFNAKWMLLDSAIGQGQWWIVMALMLGGLLAAAYLFKLIGQAFTAGDDVGSTARVSRSREICALLLGCSAVGLGFVSMPVLELLAQVGGASELRP